VNRRAETGERFDRERPTDRTGTHGQSDARPRFDALFADPRHYRGDCRLMRTAIRRGWLNDADRDALVARFEKAMTERHAADADNRNVRALMAECAAMIELEQARLTGEVAALRWTFEGKTPGDSLAGRPRERWHVGDYPRRIDANAIRRRALADGMDLRSLHAIDLRPAGKPDAPGERIALTVVADARYGWRVWLLCARCGRRCGYLYPIRSGVRCWRCSGIRYGGAP